MKVRHYSSAPVPALVMNTPMKLDIWENIFYVLGYNVSLNFK